MTRDRALGGFALLVALAVIVLVLRPLWLPRRTVVRERTVTGPVTVVQSPPLTPLRDSGPKNNPKTNVASRKETASDHGSRSSSTGPLGGSTPQTPSKRKKRQAPKTTPTPRPSSQGSPQPAQPPSPQPSQPPPVVGVTAPAPVTVCARPVATVNC